MHILFLIHQNPRNIHTLQRKDFILHLSRWHSLAGVEFELFKDSNPLPTRTHGTFHQLKSPAITCKAHAITTMLLFTGCTPALPEYHSHGTNTN